MRNYDPGLDTRQISSHVSHVVSLPLHVNCRLSYLMAFNHRFFSGLCGNDGHVEETPANDETVDREKRLKNDGFASLSPKTGTLRPYSLWFGGMCKEFLYYGYHKTL